jgi:hypothetical protein
MKAICISKFRPRGLYIGLLAGLFIAAPKRAAAPPEKLPPVILVPGSPAAELYDQETGEQLFPRAKLMFARFGSDFLSLPLDHPEDTPVVPGPLIKRVRVAAFSFKLDPYGPLLARLQALGYREGDWDNPGAGPEYYVFIYDWRQSVESRAKMLYGKMTALRAKQAAAAPPFVMVAHSLGGLITRYVMMYGGAPLGRSGPLPPVTWAGGALMSHAWLVAVPNGGSFTTLAYLHHGTFYKFGWGAYSPETLFTFPAVFDMMPNRHEPLISPEGNPLNWDLNNPEDWETLHWAVFEPGALRTMTLEEARAHLRSELARKRRLQDALAARGPSPNPVVMHLQGGECEPVQRTGIVLGRNGKYSVKFKVPNGYDKDRLGRMLFEPGDSMISVRALTAAGLPHDDNTSTNFASIRLACTSHQKLMSSPLLLDMLQPVLEKIAGISPRDETLAEAAPSAAGGPAANP